MARLIKSNSLIPYKMAFEGLYFKIFGFEWDFILGIIILIGFIFTAVIPHFMKNKKLSLKWHITVAWITISLALIHAVLGIMAYF